MDGDDDQAMWRSALADLSDAFIAIARLTESQAAFLVNSVLRRAPRNLAERIAAAAAYRLAQLEAERRSK
jgi:hypothetical protein